MGIFWDIENCAIPRANDAATIACNILSRAQAFGLRTVVFKAAADSSNFRRETIAALSDMGLSIEDVGATRKGNDRADMKLMHCVYAFMNENSPPATVIIISGDSDFSSMFAQCKMKGYRTAFVSPQQVTRRLTANCADLSSNWTVWQTDPSLPHPRSETKPIDTQSLQLNGSSVLPPAHQTSRTSCAPPSYRLAEMEALPDTTRIWNGESVMNGRERDEVDSAMAAQVAAAERDEVDNAMAAQVAAAAETESLSAVSSLDTYAGNHTQTSANNFLSGSPEDVNLLFNAIGGLEEILQTLSNEVENTNGLEAGAVWVPNLYRYVTDRSRSTPGITGQVRVDLLSASKKGITRKIVHEGDQYVKLFDDSVVAGCPAEDDTLPVPHVQTNESKQVQIARDNSHGNAFITYLQNRYSNGEWPESKDKLRPDFEVFRGQRKVAGHHTLGFSKTLYLLCRIRSGLQAVTPDGRLWWSINLGVPTLEQTAVGSSGNRITEQHTNNHREQNISITPGITADVTEPVTKESDPRTSDNEVEVHDLLCGSPPEVEDVTNTTRGTMNDLLGCLVPTTKLLLPTQTNADTNLDGEIEPSLLNIWEQCHPRMDFKTFQQQLHEEGYFSSDDILSMEGGVDGEEFQEVFVGVLKLKAPEVRRLKKCLVQTSTL